MSKAFIILLILSLALHSALLHYKFEPVPKVEEKEQGGGSVKVTILPKPSESAPQIKADLHGEMAKADNCTDWYYGFGVQHDWLTNTVSSVQAGYPAHKAGIIVGDTLIDILDESGSSVIAKVHTDARYEGNIATVVIMRNGQVLNFTLRREKICSEEG
jgi:predicted metalloprotease with PDZ domain